MKKILTTALLVAALLTSCKKEEIKPSTNNNTTTTTTPTSNSTNTIEIAGWKDSYSTGSSNNLTMPYTPNSRDLVVTLNGYVILQYNSNYPVYNLSNRWKLTTADKGEIVLTIKYDGLTQNETLSGGIYINGTQVAFNRVTNKDLTIKYTLK